MDTITPEQRREVVARLIARTLPVLRGLDLLDTTFLTKEASDAVIGPVFDQLAQIGGRHATCESEANTGGMRPGEPYLEVLQNDALARRFAGLPPGPSMLPSAVAAALEGFSARLDGALARIEGMLPKPARGPLFSAAAEAYIAEIAAANGPGHPEIAYLRHRAAAFIALVGDRAVTAYTKGDLQQFIDELSWLPPRAADLPDYSPARIPDIIVENRERGGAGLSRKTLQVTYLSRVKTRAWPRSTRSSARAWPAAFCRTHFCRRSACSRGAASGFSCSCAERRSPRLTGSGSARPVHTSSATAAFGRQRPSRRMNR